MKGIVFTEFVEMVEEQFSDVLADTLLSDPELGSGGAYAATGTYPHTEMVTLVTRLSSRTGIAMPDLLNRFGRHLFRSFHRLYPGFFIGADSAFDFLERIENVIHVEVLKLYPDAQLPRFETLARTADSLVIDYRSDRAMGDLAEGLIAACLQHYGTAGTIDRNAVQAPSPAIRFTIRTHG